MFSTESFKIISKLKDRQKETIKKQRETVLDDGQTIIRNKLKGIKSVSFLRSMHSYSDRTISLGSVDICHSRKTCAV
jgi:ATP-dependent exoDNAse (exonuclease V) alpha subunit